MASSYGTHAPARKLKDSCDLCSASKLRCNKQKPTCARCASLNQPCSYSPARRAGRPHRVREKSQQQCLEMSVDSTMGSVGDGSKSREMSLDTTFLCMQSIRQDQSHPQQRQQQRQSQQQQQQQQQAAVPPSCQAPYQDAGGGDCARIAITILEQLDVARRRAGHTSVSSATTDACQRLLTILVCPCSEQPGVALLVACGCISLMDTVHHCHVLQSAPSQETLTRTTPSPSPEKDLPGWHRPSSSNNNGQGVEQLAKIAKVILQFTDRYSQEPKGGAAWTQTTWLVAPIAALLRFRLQTVTHQAAKSLVF
ncbi:uncharacterized protein TRIREDRAFT_111742 [Trichoderma reesei QM6a]|uniref:Predicted protein n=2 Tax=Hypocrea jecorina TaxID=51453 RepID=G0RVB2_HYPJQ|nr:uncharacterized protein TRIREDRAFT_111742 [Trichoderma reesei QM6a]EGR44833.1 predicted protein [Trichoderma reesei QM6a]ETR97749.1 hypothetical protein M419DRAFT_90707 [Trichoderma reesei RUT C-30]